MSAPVVTTKQLAPSNGAGKEGLLWTFELGNPVVVTYAVESSGNSRPFVRQLIQWGDGASSESVELGVGKLGQSHHSYTKAGEYSIKLGAINSSGVESEYNGYNTIQIRVVPIPKAKQPIYRWAGLALPYDITSDTDPQLQDVPVKTDFTLVDDVSEGATTILVSDGLQFQIGDDIQIFQENKLITTSKVVEVTLNQVSLDPTLPLSDSYSKSEAIVSLLHPNRGRSYSKSRVNKGWYFPVSHDNQLVKAGVLAVLSVKPFERVMLPTFGSRIHEIPFDPNDELSMDLVRSYVVDAIEAWEPRANIVSVNISEVENSIIASVTLEMNLNTFTVNFDLSQAR